MHLEIQLALNYLLQNLYHKLPRRRVNLFGEELSAQLKQKYANHWYVGNPVKGSAFRCLKTPTDPLISSAAAAVNVPLADIVEHLPADLWIWIDPGEVSYRVGGGGTVRVLWKGNRETNGQLGWNATGWSMEDDLTFEPEDENAKGRGYFGNSPPRASQQQGHQVQEVLTVQQQQVVATPSTSVPAQGGKPAPALMTTAAFAQTKFGSTKLKTNTKRSHRQMSPTEFSNYIKHKQALQASGPRPRSLSPQQGGVLGDYWSMGLGGLGGDWSQALPAPPTHHHPPPNYYTPLFEPSVWGGSETSQPALTLVS